MCIAQGLNVFATGLVACAFFMGTVAVHPVMAKLDPASHLLIRQELIRRLQRFLAPFMLVPIAASIAALKLCRHRCCGRPTHSDVHCPWQPSQSRWRVTVRLTGILRAGLQTPYLVIAQPYVRRWNLAHSIRTTVVLGAFACAIFAAN
jgi:hypothetical protein